MTHAEASAWAIHSFGGRAFAHEISHRAGKSYTVGVFIRIGPCTRGDSGHSYEQAFSHAGFPVDMNHPAILRVSLAEAIAAKDTGTNAKQSALLV